MKRSFADSFLILFFICKIWEKEFFTHYYIYKVKIPEPLIALLCDVNFIFYQFLASRFVFFDTQENPEYYNPSIFQNY